MPPKFHALNIREVKRETEDTVSIVFDIPTHLHSDYNFLSGQYLTLRTKIDGKEVRRSYSLCSSPYEKEWRIAVKKVTGGLFSSFANDCLKSGDQLDVMTPMGNFVIKPKVENARNYVLFAAGSGITPVLSIAKTVLKEEPDSSVTLFYGNKNFKSIIFREELEALKNRYMERLRIVHIFSRESLGTEIQKGRIDRTKTDQLLKAFLNNEDIDAVYICGPEEMILDVKESMVSNGVPEEHVHFELFTSPGRKDRPKKSTLTDVAVFSEVSIILDGVQLDLALNSLGENILDAAQKAGADLPYACKGGVCCTCKAKVLRGAARMDVNYGLEKDEVEAGYILTCQAHPTSERLVVSFDE